VNRDFRMGCSSPPGESLVPNGLSDGEAYEHMRWESIEKQQSRGRFRDAERKVRNSR